MPTWRARGLFFSGGRRSLIAPVPFLKITPDKKVDASHDEPLPSPPSNYMECSVNTDASCSWCSTNLTAA
ncbi:hypothetical protein C5615_25945 [Burkholderia cepacia]|uniref:Uncharacterized protein n=1 Tax=Burkholderia cepacia TaxID=292 RepID=A0A2S8IIF1_BURCE|nr:hypothetical protein C5615_25945 [Burkholderia cepacia]TDA42607.1 hypothetical protein EVG18_37470 [Burkholderia pyrrocinia]